MDNKQIATEFLQMAARGEAIEAVRQFCTSACKHHSPYFPAGMLALAKAMEDDAKRHPNKVVNRKHVLGEGDLVAVHSQVVRQTGEQIAVVHLFRFEDGKIVELWDVGLQIPNDSPNTDGPF